LRRGERGRKRSEAVSAASGNTAMLEGALLVVRGIKCDADEQHHHRQEDDPGKKLHDLQFTYLIDATLDLPVDKINADTKQSGAECSDKPKSCISARRRGN
jgi:hypothetical protein